MTETQTPEQEQKTKQVNQHRLIFFALLEAAMRYRESYFREDIEQSQKVVKELEEAFYKENKTSFSQHQKEVKKTKSRLLDEEHKLIKFNASAYAEIEKMTNILSDKGKVDFDNYSTAFGLIAEELQKAKNTTEMITLCTLYNQGVLESLFENERNKEETNLNKKYEKDNSSNIAANDISGM